MKVVTLPEAAGELREVEAEVPTRSAVAVVVDLYSAGAAGELPGEAEEAELNWVEAAGVVISSAEAAVVADEWAVGDHYQMASAALRKRLQPD